MLTNDDLLFMNRTRDEITEKRKQPIRVAYSTGAIDPWTGEVEDEVRNERAIEAVVTEISSQTSTGIDRYVMLGIKYEKGDIWLSVAIEKIADIADKIDTIEYDGKEHVILAMDKKGIGIRNRYEILARVAS